MVREEKNVYLVFVNADVLQIDGGLAFPGRINEFGGSEI